MLRNPKRIVVPLDFSPASLAGLDAAAEMAGQEGRIDVLYVLEHLTALHPAMVWETMDDAERIENALKALQQICEENGVGHAVPHAATSIGNAAMEVARFAKANDADLVVVASHGRTGLARVALGSVAERIVRYCECPVLVVKPPVG